MIGEMLVEYDARDPVNQAEIALAGLHAALFGGTPKDYMHPDGRARIPEQKLEEMIIESTPPEQQQGEQ